MKKILAGTVVAAFTIFNLSSMVGADTVQTTPVVTFSGMTSNIDDIEIPIEVLMDLQMEFQGQAVNQAKKMRINGNDVYRLRVDRDSETNDHDKDTKYVYYDMSWKRLENPILKVEAPIKVEVAPEVQTETPKPIVQPPATTREIKEEPKPTEKPQEPTDEPAEEMPAPEPEPSQPAESTESSTNP